MKFGWKTRVGVVLSAVWLCIVFLLADDYQRTAQLLGVGLLPLVVIWGAVWAFSGWRAQRQPKTSNSDALTQVDRAAISRNRNGKLQTSIAVIVVFAIGYFVANGQFHAADNPTGVNVVPAWFGEWLVYGLFAYGALRFVPRLPQGAAAVLTALLIVGAVNYRVFEAVSMDRQAYASVALATPILNKIQAGTPVSDAEVRAAGIGVLEPLVLSQAAFGRDVSAIADVYQKTITKLDIDQILAAPALASSSIRARSKLNVQAWSQAGVDYKRQIASATARGKLGVQAAVRQMPAVFQTSTAGFDKTSAQLTAFVERHVALEEECGRAITAILDLLDANPQGYVLDRGPPANILFKSDASLAEYRRQFGKVQDVAKREADNQNQFLQAQTSRSKRLEETLRSKP